MALTAKQQRFVSEYLTDFNGTQAAIRAGYSASGARTEGARLLANAGIQGALRDLQADYATRHGITIDHITEMHRQAYEVGLQTLNPSAMTTAAQNLAKLHGLIVDRAAVKVSKSHAEWIELLGTMTDAELDSRIDARAGELGYSRK